MLLSFNKSEKILPFKMLKQLLDLTVVTKLLDSKDNPYDISCTPFEAYNYNTRLKRDKYTVRKRKLKVIPGTWPKYLKDAGINLGKQKMIAICVFTAAISLWREALTAPSSAAHNLKHQELGRLLFESWQCTQHSFFNITSLYSCRLFK